jgi:hypothetical protein
MMVNVAIYTAGIKSGDSQWTISGKPVLAADVTRKDALFNLVHFLRRGYFPEILKSRKQLVSELPLLFA